MGRPTLSRGPSVGRVIGPGELFQLICSFVHLLFSFLPSRSVSSATEKMVKGRFEWSARNVKRLS